MKIILFAYQNWGVEAIQSLMKSDHQIISVYTHPITMDKNEKIWYESVYDQCKINNIDVIERINLTEEDAMAIRKISPDVLLSVGWRRLIPRYIFEIPRYGAINIHDGLLPKYRGFAPINWSMINGEEECGITSHYVDDGIDTGDIIIQKKVSVNIDETAYDVYSKILPLTKDVVLETLNLLESEKVKRIKQENLGEGFFCSRRFPDDSKINWLHDNVSVYNHIRALSDPYPNAFCFYEGKKILIKKARLVTEDIRGTPGLICTIKDEGVVVTCGENHDKNQAILIVEISFSGTIYKAKDFFKKLWMRLE